MAYEYEESNKQIVFTVDNESSMGELNERIKELKEVYFKAETLNKIIDIIKVGRNLGVDSDSEIILKAIEHELEYLEGNDE